MRVTPRRTSRLTHEARYVDCAPDRSRILAAGKSGAFTILNSDLGICHRGKLPVVAGQVALHPGADWLAIASTSEIVLSTFDGEIIHRRRHRPWENWEGGDVAFVRDGSQLLAICPKGAAAKAILLRTDSGELLAEQAIDVPEASGFFLIPTPIADRWGIWAGAGQDGQWTFWLGLEGDRITVDEVTALHGVDHGPVELHASVKELLVSADDALLRYRYPDMELLGRIEPPDDEEFQFTERCAYLGQDRALACDNGSARLYVVDLVSRTVADEVRIGGHRPPWYFTSLPGAAVLSVHGSPLGRQTLALLEGPPLW